MDTKKAHRSAEHRRVALAALEQGEKVSVVASTLGVSRRTLTRWRREFREYNKISPSRPPGRKRKLTEEDEKVIARCLEEDSSLSNVEISKRLKVPVSSATITRIALRNGFTRRKPLPPIDLENVLVKDEIKKFVRTLNGFPRRTRIYFEEIATTLGRSYFDEKSPRKDKPYTVFLAVRESGLLHKPLVRDFSPNDNNFYDYVKNVLAPKLKRGDVVIWDRLAHEKKGRKGARKQHFNRKAMEAIEEVGATVLFLQLGGKYFNPLEDVYQSLKKSVRSSLAQLSDKGLLYTTDPPGQAPDVELDDDQVAAHATVPTIVAHSAQSNQPNASVCNAAAVIPQTAADPAHVVDHQTPINHSSAVDSSGTVVPSADVVSPAQSTDAPAELNGSPAMTLPASEGSTVENDDATSFREIKKLWTQAPLPRRSVRQWFSYRTGVKCLLDAYPNFFIS